MKKIVLTTLLVTALGGLARADQASTNTPVILDNAQEHKFGAGLVLGEPTGASLKCWLGDKLAIDGAVGWSFRGEDNLHLHSDLLYHWFDLIEVSRGKLPIYFGGGARVKFQDDSDDRFGFRVPAGIAYMFEDIPVDIFFEVAPILDVTPRTRWEFTAGIGARYWF